MSDNKNTMTPDDYATPEQIDRSIERLRKRGDRGQTGNLLAGWEAEERARAAKECAEFYRLQDEAFDRRQALRARGGDLADDSAGLVLDGWVGSVAPVPPAVIPAGNTVFNFHADGSDLPLFSS
jgi:hypothetical protein